MAVYVRNSNRGKYSDLINAFRLLNSTINPMATRRYYLQNARANIAARMAALQSQQAAQEAAQRTKRFLGLLRYLRYYPEGAILPSLQEEAEKLGLDPQKMTRPSFDRMNRDLEEIEVQTTDNPLERAQRTFNYLVSTVGVPGGAAYNVSKFQAFGPPLPSRELQTYIISKQMQGTNPTFQDPKVQQALDAMLQYPLNRNAYLQARTAYLTQYAGPLAEARKRVLDIEANLKAIKERHAPEQWQLTVDKMRSAIDYTNALANQINTNLTNYKAKSDLAATQAQIRGLSTLINSLSTQYNDAYRKAMLDPANPELKNRMDSLVLQLDNAAKNVNTLIQRIGDIAGGIAVPPQAVVPPPAQAAPTALDNETMDDDLLYYWLKKSIALPPGVADQDEE